MKEKVLFAWSGGKDSSIALYDLKKDSSHEVSALLTTITSDYDRISMHGVRSAFLEAQAESLNLPLEKVLISKTTSSEEYEKKMGEKLAECRKKGIFKVAFGDIFLEDLKKYREEKLLKAVMNGIFPLWKQKTSLVARRFIDLGFRAIITCVDSKSLGGEFAGRIYDESFLSDLPKNVDPCGENGEFHSFVYDGPIFKQPIPFNKGNVVLRDNRFYFQDIIEHSAATVF